MRNEYSYSPKPQNKKANVIFYITFVAAIVVYFVSIFIERYKGVVATLAVALMATAILFYTKFISAALFYDLVVDSAGESLFVVRQQTGTRQTTLCRVDLENVVSVKPLSAAELRAIKPQKNVKRYSYKPTLMPKSVCLINVESRYETAEIIVEGDIEFINTLNSYVAIAKAKEE